jgi:hypothetical protein
MDNFDPDLIDPDAINVVLGSEAPDHITMQLAVIGEHDKVLRHHSVGRGHPQDAAQAIGEAISSILESDKEFYVIRTNRYDALKEIELIAREGRMNINWIVCDGDEPETYNQQKMPMNSVVEFSASQYERDLDLAFE